ncbi:MAG: cation:proton antiporter, partial [Acidimicrobiia bacterium]|nr:cation:proton antiporter [Acidimicrobiia bacterium]
LRAFFANKANSITYGLLGFAIPFVLSVAVSMSFSELGFLAACLIGAMWASNTLVAYPEVVAAGLQNNRAVSAAVSAGVVADLLSLTVLALASSTAVIEIEPSVGVEATNSAPALPIWVGIPLLVVVTMWLLPKIGEWFFVRVGHTRAQRFVFAIAAMAGGAVMATLGGVEGLIGAFLAGLGLNRIVPSESQLMQRLDFVGGTVFVPAFLVSIGLSIDPTVLFDPETLVLAAFYTMFVVVGKTIAAVVTGAIFGISRQEIGLMAALSTGQAASTLAIAQVGLTLGFFGQNVVNAAVLTIVICAFITSIGTRHFAGRVDKPAATTSALGERVLIDTRSHGGVMEDEVAVAGAIARADDGVMTPFAISETGHLDDAKLRVANAETSAAEQGHDAIGVVRVDDSFAAGTLRLAEEKEASLVIMGWDGLNFGRDFMFGNEIDAVGERSSVPTMALRVEGPWHRVLVVTGDLSGDWHREDAEIALTVGHRLARVREVPMVVFTPDEVAARSLFEHELEDVEVVETASFKDRVLTAIRHEDIVLAPAHVVQQARGLWSWKVARALRDCSVGVVAGPHRLSVSGSPTARTRDSLIGPPTDHLVTIPTVS